MTKREKVEKFNELIRRRNKHLYHSPKWHQLDQESLKVFLAICKERLLEVQQKDPGQSK